MSFVLDFVFVSSKIDQCMLEILVAFGKETGVMVFVVIIGI